jgi:uncharacterized membrane protein YbhN (UPF0104 family)
VRTRRGSLPSREADASLAWALFVALALYALAFLSIFSVSLLVHDSGAHASTVAWFLLPAALLLAARTLSSLSRPRRMQRERQRRAAASRE